MTARKGENSVSSSLNSPVAERDALASDETLRIKSISFRDKRLGWKKYSFVLSLAKASADGKQNTVSFSHIHPEDPYMKAFLSNINLRPSCYHCPAKSGRSGADITLADYWGVNLEMPDYDDDRGVSLALINTDKGKDAFNSLQFDSREVSAEASLRYNPSFYRSVMPHPNREKFFSQALLDNVDVVRLMNRVTRMPRYSRMKRRLKAGIKTLLMHIGMGKRD